MSPQLSCGDTWQIWTRLKIFNLKFYKIKISSNGEINERSFSNPHPWPLVPARLASLPGLVGVDVVYDCSSANIKYCLRMEPLLNVRPTFISAYHRLIPTSITTHRIVRIPNVMRNWLCIIILNTENRQGNENRFSAAFCDSQMLPNI